MLRFEHESIFEEEKSKTIIEETVDEDIDDVMTTFIRFLRGISYSDTIIKKGLKEAIETIDEDITYNYETLNNEE